MSIKHIDFITNQRGGGYGAAIGSIVGAVAGIVLAPYTFGTSYAAYLAAAGSLIGGVVGRVIDSATMSQPSGPQPQIQDLAIQTTTYGGMIPKVYGRFSVAGNIIQTTEKQPHVHTVSAGGGGGGSGGFGGSSSSSTTVTYTASLAIGICEGEIDRIARVWADDTIIHPGQGYKLISTDSYAKDHQTVDGTQFFTLYHGTETQLPDPFFESVVGVGNQPAYRGLAYIVMQNLNLGSAGRVPNFRFEVIRLGVHELTTVVRSICEEVGLTTSDLSIQLGTFPVDMLVSEIQSAKSILDQLAEAYNFVGIESENKIKFSLKLSNNSPILSIPEDALSGAMDNPDKESLSIVRLQEADLPTKVIVNYAASARNYHTASQILQLVNSQLSDNPITIGFQLALNEQEARRITVALLYEPWTNREIASGSLPFMCVMLDPFDFVSLTARNFTYLLRMVELNHGNNWLLNFKALEFDPDLASLPVPVVTTLPPPPVTATFSPIIIIIIDAPPLNANDILPRYFAVAYPSQPNNLFTNAGLYDSQDNSSYTLKKSLNIPGVTGTVSAALPSASQYVWDDTHTLTVVLDSPINTLESRTDLDVLNGANQAMYGLECIGYGTVTLVGSSTYQLTHLLRGRQGTESRIGSHTTNETFVLLNTTATNNGRVPYNVNDVGINKYYKVTDPFTNLPTAVAFQRTLAGISIRPWAPILLPASCNTPSTNDYTFYWYHRSRLNDGVWQQALGITYDPDDTGTYRIIIYTGSTYVVVKRIYTSSFFPIADDLRSFVYPIADQTVDFGSHQTTVYYSVQTLASVHGYQSFGVAVCP